MSGTVFRNELKMSMQSVATWSVALAALLVVFFSLFQSFSADAALLNEMMDKFPPALLTAFGMTGVDLSSVLGFFGFVFLFVQICLAIQAAYTGFALVSVEEREWTADFLLAKPIGRTEILNSKLLAALCGLAITDVVVWASSVAAIRLFAGASTYDSRALLLLLLSIIPFQLFFLGVGLSVSLLVKRIRSVTPYAMALAFGMYVLSVFGDMMGESVLEKITPFRFFDARSILADAVYDAPLILISIVVTAVCLAASYVLYGKRDIPAVV